MAKSQKEINKLAPLPVPVLANSKLKITPLDKAITKFEQTGTADVITGKDFGVSVKDEGDYISVRFGSNDLVPVGSVPSGERNFATKAEAFDFVKQLQELLKYNYLFL